MILLLHVLAATVWTGGHIVLACAVLPTALRTGDLDYLRRFENGFEKVGIPALLLQVVTGLWLALRLVPDWQRWFAFADPVAGAIGVKLLLLAATLLLAADARLRLIPRLSADNLVTLAWHIIPVTLLSIAFVVVGVWFRSGWFL